MNFAVKLVLPPRWVPGGHVNPVVWDHAIDMVDDDPDCPLFLTRAADIFSANGVRLEFSGFFKEPLAVPTDLGLVYVLESLPGFLKFLLAPSSATCTLGLWVQGIETEFCFSVMEDSEIIEVTCLSAINREMDHTRELLPRCWLIGQMAEFVKDYREATTRYAPELVGEAWNQKLFAAAAELIRCSSL